MITRRLKRNFIGLLLPVFVLNAFVPAGYMALADESGLRIVMCSDGLNARTDGSDRSENSSPSNSAPAAASTQCPFGHGSGAAPLLPFQPAGLSWPRAVARVAPMSRTSSAAFPIGVHLARGPPA